MRRAFTLLEMVIVLAVTTVLAAVGIIRAGDMAKRGQYAATYASMQAIAAGADYYKADFQSYPPDYEHTEQPTALLPYLQPGIWNRKPPIGGLWDWNNTFGGTNPTYWSTFGANVSVKSAPKRSTDYPAIDKAFDNNSTSTGALRTKAEFLCYLMGG